ncbi:DUF4333 domain-containing protein [Mycobacteroides abscessus]|uniref:DUF4333 domain-containing protein n=1 Tax=Mycobacteroides abscessus TaxID=36809 RepID=UPI0009D281CF|nr:DUF4333 domain-containing protein [Mycobacteroides abscessus]SKI74622.1 Uncharacterised protein [Mycobacteroides abscessus subsp. massiliense]SKM55703.1 Uncharacterised protein [Mycobacteroides abscessus subsp. massiliense]SKP98629.1 Uncharacterised protein [Mycobacteroides abscessus subsp. massiliense]SKQ07202.1 Uncharacterised protein [Mycobacteroides abscessus subsp. massiliense]SLL01727.1 Uncharacterised protein [Mycobacteroides abscessus subsp. massiliense]
MISAIMLSITTLSGCHASVDVGNFKRISKDNLEQGLKDAVKERQHFDLQSAVCDGPLDGKIDATQKCTVVDDEGTKYAVVVTTTSVNGDDIKFKYKAEPISKPA